MGAPEFVLKLREKIGNDALWLPAVRGVVFDDDGQRLACRLLEHCGRFVPARHLLAVDALDDIARLESGGRGR